MKALQKILMGLLLLTTHHIYAQYVALPDSNFGHWLKGHGYTSCITGTGVSGYSLDTTCSAVAAATHMDCHYSNIYNISGVEFFRNLQYLDCGNNHLSSLPFLTAPVTWLACDSNALTALPALPAGLLHLDAHRNTIGTWPALPAGLDYLDVSYNGFITLPALPSSLTNLNINSSIPIASFTLPASLDTLRCQGSALSALPALPSGMRYLYAGSNNIGTLPALPASLTYLNCQDNGLSALPALPASLQQLQCHDNNITSLPTLPAAMTQLYCLNNQLTALPALPAGLRVLSCRNNHITSLPALPSTLSNLNCGINPITIIPALPAAITFLDCDSTLISTLPYLPPHITALDCSKNPLITCLPRIYAPVLTYIYIVRTGIHCLPNSFTSILYDVPLNTLPLCDAASGCDFSYNITGSIHYDTASTCLSDSLYPGPPVRSMKARLKLNGNVVQQFYTFTSGTYSFAVDSLTGYTVDIDTAWLPLAVSCPASGERIVALSATDSVETHQDFGIVCSSSDFGIYYMEAGRFRPADSTTVIIAAGNMAALIFQAPCGAGTSGTITTTISGSAQYAGPAVGALTPSSVAGNVLTYTIADLDSLRPGSLNIVLTTDTTAAAGSSVCIQTILTPSVPDMYAFDNIFTQCFEIVNSWDPNHKDVYPANISQQGDWLTYTIHFQNTGSDTAYTVVVRDTLSQNVDETSFQYLASSHRAVVQLTGHAMTFTFPHINLVDSATNPALSEGWIQYKVKAKSNLALQTQIRNTAYIYFDFNPAIATNTAVTSVGPAGINDIAMNASVRLYPNPNNGTFTLQTSNSTNGHYIITDMLGHVIAENAITSDTQSIDMREAAVGVYALSVKGGQSSRQVRFTVVR